MSDRLLGPFIAFPDCHLWIGSSESAEPSREEVDSEQFVTSLLSEHEISRWRRYRTLAKKRQFIESRIIVREILSKMFPENVREIRMVSEPSGRPRLINRSNIRIGEISLSHSGRFVAVAVSFNGAVGVDIEAGGGLYPESFDALFLATEEKRQLESQCRLWGKWGARVGWVVKEAAWKAFSGVRQLNAFEISIQCCHDRVEISGQNSNIDYHLAEVRLFSVRGLEVIFSETAESDFKVGDCLGCIVQRPLNRDACHPKTD